MLSISGKTSEGKVFRGRVSHDSLASAASEAVSQASAQGITLVSLTIRQPKIKAANFKVSEPRKRADKATGQGASEQTGHRVGGSKKK